MESIYIFADNEIIEYDGELASDTLVEFLYDVSDLWSVRMDGANYSGQMNNLTFQRPTHFFST